MGTEGKYIAYSIGKPDRDDECQMRSVGRCTWWTMMPISCYYCRTLVVASSDGLGSHHIMQQRCKPEDNIARVNIIVDGVA